MFSHDTCKINVLNWYENKSLQTLVVLLYVELFACYDLNVFDILLCLQLESCVSIG